MSLQHPQHLTPSGALRPTRTRAHPRVREPWLDQAPPTCSARWPTNGSCQCIPIWHMTCTSAQSHMQLRCLHMLFSPYITHTDCTAQTTLTPEIAEYSRLFSQLDPITSDDPFHRKPQPTPANNVYPQLKQMQSRIPACSAHNTCHPSRNARPLQ